MSVTSGGTGSGGSGGSGGNGGDKPPNPTLWLSKMKLDNQAKHRANVHNLVDGLIGALRDPANNPLNANHAEQLYNLMINNRDLFNMAMNRAYEITQGEPALFLQAINLFYGQLMRDPAAILPIHTLVDRAFAVNLVGGGRDTAITQVENSASAGIGVALLPELVNIILQYLSARAMLAGKDARLFQNPNLPYNPPKGPDQGSSGGSGGSSFKMGK